MFTIKNILLTTDFSKFSFSAAEHAISLAEKYNAKVHILYVLEKTPPILAIRSLDLSGEKIIKSMEDDADSQMKEALNNIKKSGLEFIPVIRKGVDYIEIINYCNSNEIDLIVLASHGRTGILHTLIGSVAEKVIRYAKCPVFVVRQAEEN